VLLDDDEEVSWSRDRSWLWEEEEVTGEEGLKKNSNSRSRSQADRGGYLYCRALELKAQLFFR
jgi:hypothetical protein